jgi:nitrogenase iron protein NifH
LAQRGLQVLLIGCDPKADSTRTLMGRKIPPVLQVLQSTPEPQRDELLHTGFCGVACVESGGPKAGVGCAGRGIITALEELSYHKVFEEEWDLIIYDVLGDVVCGGFSVPMRDSFVDEVYIVTSPEYMSLYAANNILSSVRYFSEHTALRLGGLVCNQRGAKQDCAVVSDYGRLTGASIAGKISYASEIFLAELHAKTAVELFPDSVAAGDFQTLADVVVRGTIASSPCELGDEAMETFILRYLSREQEKQLTAALEAERK